MLAQDLRHPKFRISLGLALRRRLKRNYVWMYLILLLAWVLKITSPRLQEEGATVDAPRSAASVIEQASLGPVPGWIVIAIVCLTYLALALIIVRGRRSGMRTRFMSSRGGAISSGDQSLGRRS